jgi:hypothetical protein
MCRCMFSVYYISLQLMSSSSAHPVGSGVMLLGGFGFLSRLHGLSIDSLVEVRLLFFFFFLEHMD